VAPIVALIAVGTVANASTSWLAAHHPLALIALEARNRNLLLVANRVDLLPFVLVGVARRMVSDPLFFLLGHLYGQDALRWAERRLGGGHRLVALTERGFRRASGVMVFLFPGALVCVLAGVSRMRPAVFGALNLAGTLCAVVVLRTFAGALEGPLDALLAWNERNVKWVTAALVAGVVAWLWWQHRRGTGDLRAVRELAEELDVPSAPDN
jgi:membrane protein DedA with SNARE-associated domain